MDIEMEKEPLPQQMENLLAILEQNKSVMGKDDTYCWIHDKERGYSIKSFLSEAYVINYPKQLEDHVSRFIW